MNCFFPMILGLALAVAFAATPVQASCGASFCAINTQWALQGVWSKPGVRLDVRHEYIDQDQPRIGTREVAVGEVSGHHDEVSTLNRNTIATLDYTSDEGWGMSLVLPYVQREHTHIHNHHGTAYVDEWDVDGLADIRVLGHMKEPGSEVSLLLGAKLPTGKTDVDNENGYEAERSLQPGTGTTDLLAGMAWQRGSIRSPWSFFAQVLWQKALDDPDDYTPGEQWSLDAGTRYSFTNGLSLMAQLNGVIRARDTGTEAEPHSSGSDTVYFSPGASLSLGKRVQVYGFVQQPLYQYVTGVQLTAERAMTAGISVRL